MVLARKTVPDTEFEKDERNNGRVVVRGPVRGHKYPTTSSNWHKDDEHKPYASKEKKRTHSDFCPLRPIIIRSGKLPSPMGNLLSLLPSLAPEETVDRPCIRGGFTTKEAKIKVAMPSRHLHVQLP